jgi:hypothetical protein
MVNRQDLALPLLGELAAKSLHFGTHSKSFERMGQKNQLWGCAKGLLTTV